MRKDYTATIDGGEDETAFVERYWTEVWQREGGPKNAVDKISGKAECKIMQPYIDTLPKGARLLDGGCGLGDWTAYFSRLGWPTIGLDISRKTVEQLKEVFPDEKFEVGDIRAIDLPDESIDGYFSWGTFEHFEDGLDKCVDEAFRVLKPGGYLFISVPYDNFRHAARAAFARSDKVMPADEQRRFYQWRLTRRELADCLSFGGFEVLKVRPIHKRQGVLRSLHHEFGLPYQWLLTKGMSVLLSPFIPGSLVAHMIMAVARKPL